MHNIYPIYHKTRFWQFLGVSMKYENISTSLISDLAGILATYMVNNGWKWDFGLKWGSQRRKINTNFPKKRIRHSLWNNLKQEIHSISLILVLTGTLAILLVKKWLKIRFGPKMRAAYAQYPP